MPSFLRLVLLLVVSSALLSPEAGVADNCKNKFYIVSLKDSYLNMKYKVREFFLKPGLNIDIYSIPKMPVGWHYDIDDIRSSGLIAAAYTDKKAVDIEYFKDFLSFVLRPEHPEDELYFSMTLICQRPDGLPIILVLHSEDFKVEKIHKCLKAY